MLSCCCLHLFSVLTRCEFELYGFVFEILRQPIWFTGSEIYYLYLFSGSFNTYVRSESKLRGLDETVTSTLSPPLLLNLHVHNLGLIFQKRNCEVCNHWTNRSGKSCDWERCGGYSDFCFHYEKLWQLIYFPFSYNPFILLQKERMEKTIDNVRSNFNSIRTGRASPAMLDKIEVRRL